MACTPSEEESTQQQLDNVKTETKAAARDMKDYTFAQKAEFTEKLKDGFNQARQWASDKIAP